MNELLLNANALRIPLAPESVDTCVTSPPYYGLRDYQVGGQLGLEDTPEAYVANMVAVFREVWRVMKPEGVLFLNIGDSYYGPPAGNKVASGFQQTSKAGQSGALAQFNDRGATSAFKDTKLDGAQERARHRMRPVSGLKPKDLIGIPWMLAFALRADGWYLRSDIIWAKPNPMPESVTDRPTKSHEYIFLLAKSKSYYYDSAAIAEKTVDADAIKKYNNSHENTGDDRGRQTLSGERKRAGKESGVLGFGSGEGFSREMEKDRGGTALRGELQEFGKEEGGVSPLLRERKGEGSNQEVSEHPKGQREFIEGSSQAAGQYEHGYLRPDGRPMAGNQGRTKQQMRDLRGDETTDEGSHSSPDEGRTAYEEEYSSTLPELQRQKGRPHKNLQADGQQPNSFHLARANGEPEKDYPTRNKRSVWIVTTKPYSGAHFATFPPDLIEPCIKAGCPKGGIVLDPFVGSGTTCWVARKLERSAVGIDLSFAYLHEQARQRLGMTENKLL